MQILGAIGVEFYCSRNAPGDPELESYIRQLWDVARTEDLPGWSADCSGLCDGLGARFASGNREHLRRLCNAAYEIAGSQMYSNYKPEQASRFLGEVGELAEVDLDSLALSEVFCRHAPGSMVGGIRSLSMWFRNGKKLRDKFALGIEMKILENPRAARPRWRQQAGFVGLGPSRGAGWQ
jgi:hypothetical protein